MLKIKSSVLVTPILSSARIGCFRKEELNWVKDLHHALLFGLLLWLVQINNKIVMPKLKKSDPIGVNL